ncbi:hypothetical protein HMPREF1548_03914 [Clostridium sp. KLE 1755]|nr:hypothetical protein HMPREF1548_03914 [Clostridium sp. KLE 1755]
MPSAQADLHYNTKTQKKLVFFNTLCYNRKMTVNTRRHWRRAGINWVVIPRKACVYAG